MDWAEDRNTKHQAGDLSASPAADPGERTWMRVPWGKMEQQVSYLQKRIAHASQQGDRGAVHLLQQQLIASEAARLLAVRRVTEENEGRDTAGVDGVKSPAPAGRLAMASTIHPANWHRQPARPVRRVWIPKPGTLERRPLGIFPMIDRCKQALVKLALEPEWEVQFEPHSYGFRPERGARDAIRAIAQAISHQPGYVFDADIEQAFDQVNQAVLLEKLHTYPALRQVIRGWLTAGVIDRGTYLPSPRGLVQGGVLSPLLLNIALHGMETAAIGDTRKQTREHPFLVRYGDDFVILHTDLHILQQAAGRVRQWLTTPGLQLNAQKTRILHTLHPFQGQAGFEFLGFALCQYSLEPASGKSSGLLRPGRPSGFPQPSSGWRTVITPGNEASKRHLAVVGQRMRHLQTAPQQQLIRELNPLIGGWAAYYSGLVADAVLHYYDEQMEQLLLKWASQRHPGTSHDWLRTRYWRQRGEGEQVFAAPEGAALRRYQQSARAMKAGDVL
ncbi:MAG TPA: reverse transcriptase domain-containing protein [Ktedonobacteraceae bacterium]|jgi:RNA-directed DNA polymerase